jgi:hypothetical protein
MDCQVRVAVLEEKVEQFERLLSKFDSAIEKIAEVNNNVSRMLAKLRDKVDSDHELLSTRISLLEKKLWICIGTIGAVLIASNPASIENLKNMMTSNPRPAIMTVHAKTVDGSR